MGSRSRSRIGRSKIRRLTELSTVQLEFKVQETFLAHFVPVAFLVVSFIRCAGVPWHVELHFLLLCSLVAAHFIRGIIASPSSFPSWDREYSTRGGISANDFLFMSFSA